MSWFFVNWLTITWTLRITFFTWTLWWFYTVRLLTFLWFIWFNWNLWLSIKNSKWWYSYLWFNVTTIVSNIMIYTFINIFVFISSLFLVSLTLYILFRNESTYLWWVTWSMDWFWTSFWMALFWNNLSKWILKMLISLINHPRWIHNRSFWWFISLMLTFFLIDSFNCFNCIPRYNRHLWWNTLIYSRFKQLISISLFFIIYII